jgi:hypothetical protein
MFTSPIPPCGRMTSNWPTTRTANEANYRKVGLYKRGVQQAYYFHFHPVTFHKLKTSIRHQGLSLAVHHRHHIGLYTAY